MAAVFLAPAEIAIMLELDVLEVKAAMQDEAHPFYRAFFKGRLQSEFDLRRSIVKLATSGSSPAQTMAMDLLNKSKLKML